MGLTGETSPQLAAARPGGNLVSTLNQHNQTCPGTGGLQGRQRRRDVRLSTAWGLGPCGNPQVGAPLPCAQERAGMLLEAQA